MDELSPWRIMIPFVLLQLVLMWATQFVSSPLFREASDSPHVAAKAKGRRPQGADLHSDDPNAGRAGAVPQLPRTHLPPPGRQHACGAETGQH